ncbi:hypothetical protein DPMN_001863 [Dreissena polymorpha]|uniref:Uncharacterized protein n=1 Tax=Dreissena polymorpha TaxID=45954 RepID=A0A9D4ML47_DREPO|nr:hypothetical protein DPMN_001863 [Dreissena polymorpha]
MNIPIDDVQELEDLAAQQQIRASRGRSLAGKWWTWAQRYGGWHRLKQRRGILEGRPTW